MKKAYISGFQRYQEGGFLKKIDFVITENIEEADLVVLTGGADISPEIYNEPKHWNTYTDPRRDEEDRKSVILATSLGIPMLGICRGAQLLCALSGGSLYQDVNCHSGNHQITHKETGEKITTNSVHHQGMRPGKDAITHWVATHECTAISFDQRNGEFITEKITELAEIITIPKWKAVAVQGHPEFSPNSLELDKFRSVVGDLVKSFQEAEVAA